MLLSAFNKITHRGNKCGINPRNGNHSPHLSDVSILLKPSESVGSVVTIFIMNNVFIP